MSPTPLLHFHRLTFIFTSSSPPFLSSHPFTFTTPSPSLLSLPLLLSDVISSCSSTSHSFMLWSQLVYHVTTFTKLLQTMVTIPDLWVNCCLPYHFLCYWMGNVPQIIAVSDSEHSYFGTQLANHGLQGSSCVCIDYGLHCSQFQRCPILHLS